MTLEIKGPIISNDDAWIYDWLEYEYTSPKVVKDYLKNSNGDVEIEINSGGGSVFAGSEIYTALKSHKGKVKVNIVGIAASAASVIAMAGDTVAISPTAQIMIHNASVSARGDKHDMNYAGDFLKGVDESISNAYKLKSGLTTNELLELMDNEIWMTAKMAVELGLADEIMFDEEMQIVANVGGMLPGHVINKLRNTIKKDSDKGSKDGEKEKELENALKAVDVKLTLKNIQED